MRFILKCYNNFVNTTIKLICVVNYNSIQLKKISKNIFTFLCDYILYLYIMNTIGKFFYILIFCLSVISVLPGFNFNYFFQKFTQKPFNNVSSVWCSKGFNETKICKFKNICYDSSLETLLFFLTNVTVIKGISHYTELQKIQLSSLSNHNQFYANLSLVTNYYLSENLMIEPKVFLLSRFKPNNIMHVIHDDLFPLYLTLEQVCAGESLCIESYRLLFHDKFSTGSFFDLYKLFSSKLPLLLNQYPRNSILCFEEMLVGLVQDSIFYQYGFGKPQGSLKTPYLSPSDVTRFGNFIKNKLNSYKIETDVVVISRQINRKILNINNVISKSKKLHENIYHKKNSKILVLDLNNSNVFKLIQAVSQSDILIGMHGAEMIFSLFMKPNSTIIEFFPYGIQPEIVSFIKPLAEAEGSYLNYVSWENKYKNNSFAHPQAHPMFGGISHLDEKMQEKIKNMKEVPAVECCNNPVYLYHMYQDTWVMNNFDESVYDYFKNKRIAENNIILKKWFYPHTPFNISCMYRAEEKVLSLKWSPPFNVDQKVMYSLYIKDVINNFWREMTISETFFEVKVEEKGNHKFQIWISVLYNMSRSSDLYIECY